MGLNDFTGKYGRCKLLSLRVLVPWRALHRCVELPALLQSHRVREAFDHSVPTTLLVSAGEVRLLQDVPMLLQANDRFDYSYLENTVEAQQKLFNTK